MTDSLFSPLWYRVSNLKPRLRAHVQLHRQQSRGAIWYILEDKSSGRNYRFNSSAYGLIGQFDGKCTVQQIWERSNDQSGDCAPSQSDIIQVLSKLHQSDLLQTEITPDTEEISRRNRNHRHGFVKKFFKNPLSVKIPLWDPDEFLERCLPFSDWIFQRLAVLIWLLPVSLAAVFAAIHRSELIEYANSRIFSGYNLLSICIAYPLIKFLHELGHAITTKRGGGEVHELGVMLLVFMPVPYVNASASATFRSKYERILVSAAGIFVELFLAAIGFWVWINVGTGLIRDFAFNVMLIGGISSLLFNGNPLLRFDGYYILADALGIPNLASRSNRCVADLCRRYLFGLRVTTAYADTKSETFWLLSYSMASFWYRIAVLWIIVVLLIDKLFFIGVVLAIWTVYSQIFLPLIKIIAYIVNSSELIPQRKRAVSISVGLVAGLVVAFIWIPYPLTTQTEGIIRLPEDSHIRAGTDGFVKSLLAEPDREITAGTPLIEIDAPFIDGQVEILKQKLVAERVKYASEQFRHPAQSEMIRDEIKRLEADLNHALEKQQSKIIRSLKNGTLLIEFAEDLPGRFVKQGEILGYVIDNSVPHARIVVNQDDIVKVRKKIEGVEVRLATQLNQVYPASILREVPEAGNKLPSTALSTNGGGIFTADPEDPEGLQSTERFFQFDLQIFAPREQIRIGSRVLVRFDHGNEPIAAQLIRSLRQLFLKQFDV